jgi:hypothetical protein
VLEAYQDGSLFEFLVVSDTVVQADRWLEPDEQALMALLKERTENVMREEGVKCQVSGRIRLRRE